MLDHIDFVFVVVYNIKEFVNFSRQLFRFALQLKFNFITNSVRFLEIQLASLKIYSSLSVSFDLTIGEKKQMGLHKHHP